MDKKKLLKDLKQDINKINSIIENRKIHNLKCYLVRAVIKSGIAIDYVLPFMISTALFSCLKFNSTDRPFFIDKVKEYQVHQNIITSTGIDEERILYGEKNNRNELEFSTPWTYENGIYTRQQVIYEYDPELNIFDYKTLLEMPKEELDKQFMVSKIRKITKDSIEKEDMIYTKNMNVIISSTIDDENYIITDEDKIDNIFSSVIFLLCCAGLGYLAFNFKEVILRIRIRDKIKIYEGEYVPVSSKDVDEFKKILTLKKKNLSLLEEDGNNE